MITSLAVGARAPLLRYGAMFCILMGYIRCSWLAEASCLRGFPLCFGLELNVRMRK